MEEDAELQKCPSCGKLAKVTKKWTRNHSGRRYDYLVFHHGKTDHWVNQTPKNSRRFHKEVIQMEVERLVSSAGFKHAIFTVNEVVSSVKETGVHLMHSQIRRAVMALAGKKSLTLVRRGRGIYFINSSYLDRIYYVVKRIDISLEDTKGDYSLEKHIFRLDVTNDNPFPLQYFQFRIIGDTDRDSSKVSFKAYDTSEGENARTYFLEDSPRRKRVLIEFPSPVLPKETRKIIMQYSWPITSFFHTFTAPTPLQSLRFSLTSKSRMSLQVLKTTSMRTDVVNESERVTTTIKKNGNFIESFETKNLPPFVVIEFKWTKSSTQRAGTKSKNAYEVKSGWQ